MSDEIISRLIALESRVDRLEAQILPAVQGVATELKSMRSALETHMKQDHDTMTAWAASLKSIQADIKALRDG